MTVAYMRVSTGEFPLHEGDIRLEFPEMGEEFVCPAEFVAVYIQAPELGPNEVIDGGVPELVDGVWVQRLGKRSMTAEEMFLRNRRLVSPRFDTPPETQQLPVTVV